MNLMMLEHWMHSKSNNNTEKGNNTEIINQLVSIGQFLLVTIQANLN